MVLFCEAEVRAGSIGHAMQTALHICRNQPGECSFLFFPTMNKSQFVKEKKNEWLNEVILAR